MVQVRLFAAAPPDKRRGMEQVQHERTVVADQIRRWLADRQQQGVKRADSAVTAALNLRRAACALPPFEEDADSGALIVSGRIVIRADALDDLTRTRLREDFGLYDVAVPGLDGIRLLEEIVSRNAPRVRGRTGDVARQLVADELESSPSHMIPLSVVWKANGGAEPSGPRPGESPWTVPDAAVSGPRVAVIDTGVSAEQRGDGWLVGLARSDNLDLLNVIPLDGYLDKGAGHGQFTAGVIQQVAPGVDLDVRRGLDTDGFGDEVEIARLIVDAARTGAQIINLSLGTFTHDNQPPLALAVAIREARRVQPDILIVCAAGNHGDVRKCWPAAFHQGEFERTVVSVGALRRGDADNDAVGAPWSGHGDWVECSTFGEGVVSTYVLGEESPLVDTEDPDVFGPDSWATWTGTSFAAPQIVGAIVRTMQDDATIATPRDALDRLLKDCPVIPGYGRAIGILPV